MRRRVLLVQPSMQPPGGGNGVAAWMLESLAAVHDVTVLSWWNVDVDPIDRFFGTRLRDATFARLVVPRWWRRTVDSLPVPASLLRSSLLMRYTRHVAGGFDVVIGAHNETDYGRRGIQYVHYPAYLRPRPAVDLRWYHFGPLLDAYYMAADRLAGFSVDRMTSNVTLTNSHWTAEKVFRSLGVRAETVYPPVIARPAGLPWEQRRPGFIVMGRISREKEYERVIRILAAVRRRVPRITLTIVGTFDRATQKYFDQLSALVASLEAGSWVSFRHNLPRAEVHSLIASHRYGIHGMREEHFGMAPAEMVRGGMIVWVPNGGGQVEIVGDTPLLRYDTEEEAVDRITQVLTNPQIEEGLRAHLARESEKFSVERFTESILRVVSEFRG